MSAYININKTGGGFMKKHLILLSFLALFGSFNINVKAEGETTIEELRSEIVELEKQLTDKRKELNAMLYGEQEDGINWEDYDIDLTRNIDTGTIINKIVRIGLDSSKEIPELHIVSYIKNETTEQLSPTYMAEGSLMVEGEDYTDFAESSIFYEMLEKNGDDYIPATESTPSMVGNGWEGYRQKTYYISDPDGLYSLVDGILGGYEYKVAIFGWDEPTGTFLPTGY